MTITPEQLPAVLRDERGAYLEQRHLLDPLDGAFARLAIEHPERIQPAADAEQDRLNQININFRKAFGQHEENWSWDVQRAYTHLQEKVHVFFHPGREASHGL